MSARMGPGPETLREGQASAMSMDPAVNPCSLCGPLGASLAFKGVRKCVPVIHGSQGCATYIRRYMISHFREPVDLASSSFDEGAVVFGGNESLFKAIANVEERYAPELVAIATTCLSETIGDDVASYVREYEARYPDRVPLAFVSTPSYRTAHADGFRAALLSLVKRFSQPASSANGFKGGPGLNLFAGMVSPEDIRHLNEICGSFKLRADVLPDYSDSLDGTVWGEYKALPEGGTSIKRFGLCPRADASLEFFLSGGADENPGAWLESEHRVPNHRLQYPLGIAATDAFTDVLAELSGQPAPEALRRERGRLIDAYIDSHKYLYGVKVAIAAREELAAALYGFCRELGMQPVLCAVSGRSSKLRAALEAEQTDLEGLTIMEEADYDGIGRAAQDAGAELYIGNSKLYSVTRSIGAPLIRLDFPIHDRFGGQRILSCGYRGTQVMLDRVVNALLEKKQSENPVGYTYL